MPKPRYRCNVDVQLESRRRPTLALAPPPVPPPGPPGVPCGDDGPLDCALLVDITGSMRFGIESVKVGIPDIVAAVEATGSDYRLALVLFTDKVEVAVPFAIGNAADVAAIVPELTGFGGEGDAEASDIALETALAFDWRLDAHRVIVLMTDASPAGDDDRFNPEDDEHARALAFIAAAAGIRIAAVFVLTAPARRAETRPIMKRYARVTGGVYVETAENGTDLAARVVTIIETRGCAG